MRQTVEALNRFFSGFGVPAWPEDGVPAEERPPYITVQLIDPDWRDSAAIYARIWDRSPTFERAFDISDQIKAAIGEGVSIDTDDGAVWLFKGTPFAQSMPMPGDITLKCVYLNLIMHALTE